MRGPAFFAYANNYLVDVKFGVIVDVEASRAIRQAEVGAAKTMIERTQERFGLTPERLAADTAYGSAATLHWIIDEEDRSAHSRHRQIQARGRLTEPRRLHVRQGSQCLCVPRRASSCTRQARIHDWQTILYRASTYHCGPCPLKSKCCPKAPERKIPRSIYEDARDVARALADTAAFKQSRHDRKRVEMLFAHLKRILKLGRLRLRGPRSAQDEFPLSYRTEPTTARQTGRPTAPSRHRVRCVTAAGVKATAPNGADDNGRPPEELQSSRISDHRLLQQNRHEAAVPAAPTNVRSWGENGLNADLPPRPSLTQLRHRPPNLL